VKEAARGVEEPTPIESLMMEVPRMLDCWQERALLKYVRSMIWLEEHLT
jgi:hypothetical protein